MSDTINNTELRGYFTGGDVRSPSSDRAESAQKLESGAPAMTSKTCLIMDEVDGMSAGDRGGIGALNMLIKKTKIPIICIANDNKSQKMKPLQNTTHAIPFKRCVAHPAIELTLQTRSQDGPRAHPHHRPSVR